MASPTWWTWVWVNSRSWWWTGRPGMLRFMGSQRVRHNWVTELNWTMNIRCDTGCMYLLNQHLCFFQIYNLEWNRWVMIVLLLVFWNLSILFFTVAALIYIPSNSVRGFPFLHFITNIRYWMFFFFCCLFVFMIAILIGVRWYLPVVLICISWWLVMLNIFSCVVGHLHSLFGKNVYSVFLLIFWLGCLVLFQYWIAVYICQIWWS